MDPITAQYRIGPETTPRVIKALILFILAVGVGCLILDNVLHHGFQLLGPFSFLSLSWRGLISGYFWQPVTYLFVAAPTFSLSLVFYFLFNALLLWTLGSSVVQQLGQSRFLRLFFFAGIAAALGGTVLMALLGAATPLAGCTPAIYAILVVWTMLYPEREVLLFLTIPVRAKTLITILFIVTGLIDVLDGAWIPLVATCSGLLYGYLYGAIACDLYGPFAISRPLDLLLGKIGQRLRIRRLSAEELSNRAKIIDLKTGKPILDDDEFIDAMLSKISQYGEASLTRPEKKRMEVISKRKRAVKTRK